MLSDDNKRAIYDKFGEAGLKGDAFGGMGGMGGFQAANPMDIFESFFGSGFPGFAGMGGMDGMGGRRERAGENEQYELQIDFLDAVFGCKKELEITHLTGRPVDHQQMNSQGPGPLLCDHKLANSSRQAFGCGIRQHLGFEGALDAVLQLAA